MDTVRWNISVPAKLDKSLRMYLAESGQGRKGDLSKFIASAVEESLFTKTLRDIHKRTAHLSEKQVTALVDEAVEWARSTKPARRRKCV